MIKDMHVYYMMNMFI